MLEVEFGRMSRNEQKRLVNKQKRLVNGKRVETSRKDW